jgi:excisionase family DNA binding protein
MVTLQASRSVTFDEFCEETGFRPTTTRKMIRLGILPHIRIGRRIRIARDVVEAALRGEYNVASFPHDNRSS